mgnify:CR=1
VPRALRSLHKVDRISFSLRTKSQSVAAKRALKHAMELDDYWQLLRIRSGVFEKLSNFFIHLKSKSSLYPSP